MWWPLQLHPHHWRHAPPGQVPGLLCEAGSECWNRLQECQVNSLYLLKNRFYLNNLEKVEATNLLNRPLETFNICFCRRTCTDRIDINLWLVHHGEDFTEKKNISKIQYFRLHEWGRGTRSPVFLWRRWLQLCSNNIQCHHLFTHFAFNIVQCYFVICDLKHFLYSSIFPEYENKHNLLYLSNLMVQKTNILDWISSRYVHSQEEL